MAKTPDPCSFSLEVGCARCGRVVIGTSLEAFSEAAHN